MTLACHISDIKFTFFLNKDKSAIVKNDKTVISYHHGWVERSNLLPVSFMCSSCVNFDLIVI